MSTETYLEKLKDKSPIRRTCTTGNQVVDKHFHDHASQLQENNLTKTWVLKFKGQEDLILGFFTTNVTEQSREKLPTGFVAKGSQAQGVPLLRLCYIGVNKDYQGRGFGKELLVATLYNAIDVNEETGLAGIIIDVVEENRDEKIRWYSSFGFQLLAGSEKTMVLSMRDIIKNLGI